MLRAEIPENHNCLAVIMPLNRESEKIKEVIIIETNRIPYIEFLIVDNTGILLLLN